MKRILKAAAIFILGLVIGGWVTGYGLQKVYKHNMARLYSFNVAGDILLAESLRAGDTKLLLESADRRIVTGILEMHQNEELKGTMEAGVSLTAAKNYYVCSKSEFPAEIASIMNELPPVPESECPMPE